MELFYALSSTNWYFETRPDIEPCHVYATIRKKTFIKAKIVNIILIISIY
jgi:hypothetical protein